MSKSKTYQGELLDVCGILAFVEKFTKELGIEVEIQAYSIHRILADMDSGLTRNVFARKEDISPFKKVAHFICAFSSCAPVIASFPAELFGKEIVTIPNHQNAILAFEIGRTALHHAVIKTSHGSKTINNRITMSRHMYNDVIRYLAFVSLDKDPFPVAILLESLCYQANLDLAYSQE